MYFLKIYNCEWYNRYLILFYKQCVFLLISCLSWYLAWISCKMFCWTLISYKCFVEYESVLNVLFILLIIFSTSLLPKRSEMNICIYFCLFPNLFLSQDWNHSVSFIFCGKYVCSKKYGVAAFIRIKIYIYSKDIWELKFFFFKL